MECRVINVIVNYQSYITHGDDPLIALKVVNTQVSGGEYHVFIQNKLSRPCVNKHVTAVRHCSAVLVLTLHINKYTVLRK